MSISLLNGLRGLAWLLLVGSGAALSACDEAARTAGAVASDTALRRVAAEVLPNVERHSGLEAQRPPALGRRSRAQLEEFLLSELREQLPPERAEALGAAYTRLGLLPDTLDLHRLMRELYLEQVVGYYDPRADTLFVLEDVAAEQARTVLVHELVHALQDQHVDLDSLTDSLSRRNDRANAARAAIEGQATFAMTEWMLARTTGGGVDLTAMPEVAERMAGAMSEAAPGGMPAFSAAPRVIRETLIFPYVGGLGYVQALWGARTERPGPFGDLLPASTEQVMHPERGFGPDADVPAEVSWSSDPPDGWEEVYADALGELEIRIFFSDHLGAAGAGAGGEPPAESGDAASPEAAAAGWDGDRLRLLRGDGGEVLLWATVWDDAGEADEFARAARRAFAARYGGGGGGSAGREVEVLREEVDGRAAVLVMDLPAGTSRAEWQRAARFRARVGG